MLIRYLCHWLHLCQKFSYQRTQSVLECISGEIYKFDARWKFLYQYDSCHYKIEIEVWCWSYRYSRWIYPSLLHFEKRQQSTSVDFYKYIHYYLTLQINGTLLFGTKESQRYNAEKVVAAAKVMISKSNEI